MAVAPTTQTLSTDRIAVPLTPADAAVRHVRAHGPGRGDPRGGRKEPGAVGIFGIK